jgi:Family of unknown function (DUF5989)
MSRAAAARRPTGETMRILIDLWRFAMVRKKFWLIPVMILAVVYGALAVFTKGSVLAPFIYTIF